MNNIAFQDYYPDELSHCYGCGKNNEQGHQLKSYWYQDEQNQGNIDKTIAHFTPQPCHTAIPGFVYGGLLASLIDCHGTGSAAAIAYRYAERDMGTQPAFRFVTGALNVNFLAPTPMGVELQLIGSFIEVKPNKVIVDITLSANNVICVKGSVIAVKMPASFIS
ncbi:MULTISPECIES: PaaI family thioesterase [unclassified Pseudoalteromonas]|jgi:acyl-coenzyme A thioesterase PaaI-like protein|uniref:PaaI family thioesterase n=1 Tax=unclassified Pseudoalteromonas TaxID=194690 RepID=UPI0016047967|nr:MULTISPECIES: PaaI family thioesterase [unclassified Pseudoalteromonas]MBB1293273.1 PaaI family thioesterase [Pseudoalteromonas sp. SR41-4]MBB1507284.1 PaaI family thioesterase [Pseudoalteromonas sp. SG41-1]